MKYYKLYWEFENNSNYLQNFLTTFKKWYNFINFEKISLDFSTVDNDLIIKQQNDIKIFLNNNTNIRFDLICDNLEQLEFIKQMFNSMPNNLITFKLSINNKSNLLNLIEKKDFELFENMKMEIFLDYTLNMEELNSIITEIQNLPLRITIKALETNFSYQELLKLQLFYNNYNNNRIYTQIPAFVYNEDTVELKVSKEKIYINNIFISNFQDFQLHMFNYYLSNLIIHKDFTPFFPDGFFNFFKNLDKIEQISLENLLNQKMENSKLSLNDFLKSEEE